MTAFYFTRWFRKIRERPTRAGGTPLTLRKYLGAIEGTRTPTPLPVHGPEPCASANSATMAIWNLLCSGGPSSPVSGRPTFFFPAPPPPLKPPRTTTPPPIPLPPPPHPYFKHSSSPLS